MRTTDIVLRLHEEAGAPKLEIGNSGNYDVFYDRLQQAIVARSADIVHKGDYFRLDRHLLPEDTGSFTTYVLFREITLDEAAEDEAVWDLLAENARRLDFPEMREQDSQHQLIEFSRLVDLGDDSQEMEDTVEDILIRIAGSREELEFDTAGAEGNKILYDRLARLIYDREAEIMYKGPGLVLDENRDLFYNDDEFSVYVLFRAKRSSAYDDNDILWSRLAEDLKAPSSITLLRTAADHQVVLFTNNGESLEGLTYYP